MFDERRQKFILRLHDGEGEGTPAEKRAALVLLEDPQKGTRICSECLRISASGLVFCGFCDTATIVHIHAQEPTKEEVRIGLAAARVPLHW